jgi:hypothetical protein
MNGKGIGRYKLEKNRDMSRRDKKMIFELECIISRVQGAGSCSCDMLGIVTSKEQEQEQESGVKLLSTIVRPPGTNHMSPGTTTCHDRMGLIGLERVR